MVELSVRTRVFIALQNTKYSVGNDKVIYLHRNDKHIWVGNLKDYNIQINNTNLATEDRIEIAKELNEILNKQSDIYRILVSE